MKRYTNKQTLSIDGIPPLIPAFNIADLTHAVDTFKPAQYHSYELPQDLPVYDKSTGTFRRFIKRGGKKARVVSAPPRVMESFADKELPIAPNMKSVYPEVDMRIIQASNTLRKTRVVSGPPVPPKESRQDKNIWGDRLTPVSARPKGPDQRWKAKQNSVRRDTPSYQLYPTSEVNLARVGHNPRYTLSSKLEYGGTPLGDCRDELFSEKDEAWCYRDMY